MSERPPWAAVRNQINSLIRRDVVSKYLVHVAAVKLHHGHKLPPGHPPYPIIIHFLFLDILFVRRHFLLACRCITTTPPQVNAVLRTKLRWDLRSWEEVGGMIDSYSESYIPSQPCLTVTSECILDHKMGSFCIYKQLNYKHLMLWRMPLSINSP